MDENERNMSRVRTFYLLKRAEKLVNEVMEQQLQQFQLTPGEFLIMSLVSRSPLSSAQVARRLVSSPQAARAFIKSLENKQFIERYTDDDNKRILRIQLSEEGRRVWEVCNRVVDRLEEDYFAVLEPEELAALRHALAKLGQKPDRPE